MVRLAAKSFFGFKQISFAVVTVMLLLGSLQSYAKVSAYVDRNTISESDIIKLTVHSESDSRNAHIDLSGLIRDFEIINSSENIQISIANGKRVSSYDRVYDISPKRSGDLIIPSLHINGEHTIPISIKVTSGTNDQNRAQVYLENEVSKQEVYVQEHLVYTLRVYAAVAVEDASISPLELENAMTVKQLGTQRRYQQVLDGIRYNVTEFKYGITPETSGKLIIPEQTLAGITRLRSSNIFRRDTRRIRSKSATHVVNVLPVPDSYPKDQPWLPSEKLVIDDSWANTDVKLRVGEPETRTIKIKGAGLAASQIPAVTIPESDGLKIYPDQPSLNDQETASGIMGVRSFSTAIVPSKAGPIEMPGFEITWWNTELNRLEKSLLPTMRVSVQPAAQQSNNGLMPPITFEDSATGQTAQETRIVTSSGFWPWVSAAFAILWFGTLWLWLSGKRPSNERSPKSPEAIYSARLESRHQALKALQKASKAHDVNAAKIALIAWFQAVFPGKGINNIDNIRQLDCHDELEGALSELENHLYGSDEQATPWQGDALLKLLEQIRRNQKREAVNPKTSPLKPLYPM